MSDSGDLIHVFNEHIGSTKIEIYAVYPSKKHLSQKMKVFLDYIKKRSKTANIITNRYKTVDD